MSDDPSRATVEGKVALITGAGQGVGRRVALTFARHGARAVLVNDIDRESAERVASEVRELGTQSFAAPVDVGDYEEVRRMFHRAESDLGGVDVLVNNAGNRSLARSSPKPRPLLDQNSADWEALLWVNLMGVIHCTQQALAQMISTGYGRILTVTSDAGRTGEANGMEVYSAAKAGAAGFTRSIARLGGRFGITANCIALGATITPATESELIDGIRSERVLSRYMVRRFGSPADAAAAILFLCSESSSWITGQTLPVNGGYSLAL